MTPGSTASRGPAGRGKRRGKYRNEPVEVGGVRFDSKKEARRWLELLELQAAGRIVGLRRQVRIPLRVNGVVVCRYVADAVYVEAGRRVIEDVKSPITRMNPVYRLKRKLLAAVYAGAEIREV